MKNKILMISLMFASIMLSSGYVFAAGCGMSGCTGECTSGKHGGEKNLTGISQTPNRERNNITKFQIDMVKDRVKKFGLQADVHAVKEIPGLIQIDAQSGITYFTDATARYVIVGHLLDPVARKDLTQEEKNIGKIGALKKAIKHRQLIKGGDRRAKNAIVVFDDPDCPFCRKLEAQLGSHSGVKAYRVMSPLIQLHPQAEEHTRAILCSRNPNRTLESIMLRGQSPQTTRCANRHYDEMRAEHANLAKLYAVNGTPTLVRMTDGQVWNGYMPISMLKRWAAGENISAQSVNAAIQAGL